MKHSTSIKSVTKRAKTEKPIPYAAARKKVDAPAYDLAHMKPAIDRVRTLADLKLTVARVHALADKANDLGCWKNGVFDATRVEQYELMVAKFGRIIHESYDLRVVIIESGAYAADPDNCDGLVLAIRPKVGTRSDGADCVVHGLHDIGCIDDKSSRFVSTFDMAVREYATPSSPMPAWTKATAKATWVKKIAESEAYFAAHKGTAVPAVVS